MRIKLFQAGGKYIIKSGDTLSGIAKKINRKS